ncbi:vitamin B6 photo-protection and homoeostasis-domain-containing protein [Phyllosticta capitalensis]|uniref:Vitamin B6 photo-protection and homoeostasis-domain-containing protein n=1 Tax=Phyllosticta capitalensis TaxID=121624 RepID=A0ABR1YC94_9PEZI
MASYSSTKVEVIEYDDAGNVITTYVESGDNNRVDVILYTGCQSTQTNGMPPRGHPKQYATAADIFLQSSRKNARIYFNTRSTSFFPLAIRKDSLQAFSSSIAGMLSSRAVLEGVGVGDADATPTKALLLSVVQSSAGRVATILFAARLGTALEPECKSWRLAADFFNDTGMLLDMLSPGVPAGVPRTAVLSFASILRALCGVAAGSSKASLSAHFAKEGNLGELNAVSKTFCFESWSNLSCFGGHEKDATLRCALCYSASALPTSFLSRLPLLQPHTHVMAFHMDYTARQPTRAILVPVDGIQVSHGFKNVHTSHLDHAALHNTRRRHASTNTKTAFTPNPKIKNQPKLKTEQKKKKKTWSGHRACYQPCYTRSHPNPNPAPFLPYLTLRTPASSSATSALTVALLTSARGHSGAGADVLCFGFTRHLGEVDRGQTANPGCSLPVNFPTPEPARFDCSRSETQNQDSALPCGRMRTNKAESLSGWR